MNIFPYSKDPISNWETPYTLGEYVSHWYSQNNFDTMLTMETHNV